MSDLADQILDRMIEILSPPVAWTRGVMARNVEGKGVVHYDTTACSWCMAGALEKAAGELACNVPCSVAFSAREEAKARIRVQTKQQDMAWFNDHRWTKHEDVIRVLMAARGRRNESS